MTQLSRNPGAVPYLAVGWLWYLGTLVPVIGLVQVGGQAMALFIIIAWGIFEATAGRRRRKIILSLTTIAALLAGMVSSWVQAGHWRSCEALFSHAIRVTGDTYMAHHHWGMALTEQGRLDEAVARYRQAIASAPAYSHAYNNLAIVYVKQGRLDEAVPVFKQAIRLNPTNASFHRNPALAYHQQGQSLEAEAVMEHLRGLSGK
jgi:protein O-mannosyl-transferase